MAKKKKRNPDPTASTADKIDGRGAYERTRQFWRLSARDKRSGHVILEVYKLRTSGQPFKIDKLIPTIDQFSEDWIYKTIAKKEGAGAYRVRHYNLSGSSHTSMDFIIKGMELDGALSNGEGREEREERMRKLEEMNFTLQKQMLEIQGNNKLIDMKILEAQTRMEMFRRREELEIKQMEMELNQGEEKNIIEKAMEAMQDEKSQLGQLMRAILKKYTGNAP